MLCDSIVTYTSPKEASKQKKTKEKSAIPPCLRWMTNMIVDKEKMTTTWMKIKEKEVAKLNFLASYLKCLTETAASQDWNSISAQRKRDITSGCPSTPTGGNTGTSLFPSWGSIHGLRWSDRQGNEKGREQKERKRGWLPLRVLSWLRNVCSPWLSANSHYLER